jgi:hypothetical protein
MGEALPKAGEAFNYKTQCFRPTQSTLWQVYGRLRQMDYHFWIDY